MMVLNFVMFFVYTSRAYNDVVNATGATRRNQISHATARNRYPHVFTEVHKLSQSLKNGHAPKILSFGSSTGVEALTLASKYFHHSVIVGIDVDDKTLNEARENTLRANFSDRVFFFNDLKLPLHSLGTYDIIFADSVLCHHPWDFRKTAEEWCVVSPGGEGW